MSREASPSPAELRAMLGDRFAEHRGKSTTTGGLPSLVAAFDPDSRATAYAVGQLDVSGDAYVVQTVAGGGTPKECVPHQDVLGCLALLRELLGERDPGELVVVVETQRHGSEWAASCEGLWRQRFHLESACLLLGVSCVMVEPQSWMRAFVPSAFKRGAGKGAAKIAYKLRARELVGAKVAVNEDRCAAIGMLWWFTVAELGAELRGPA